MSSGGALTDSYPTPDRLPKPKTCVIVSYWAGRSVKPLHRLLAQMQMIGAGVPYDLTIVCNGGDELPLALPSRFEILRPRVLNRENRGYNIGAWEHGWRNSPDYLHYLFLQDDCFLKTPGWIREFEDRIERDPGMGLLGEMIVFDQMSWEYVRESEFWHHRGPSSDWPEPIHPIDNYRQKFEKYGIPWGNLASHLPSIILFSSRAILEEIDGFPWFGPSYREAICSELAISRLVELHGYRFSKVRDSTFALIGHPQWAASGKIRITGFRATMNECIWWCAGQFKRKLGLRLRVKPSRFERPSVPWRKPGSELLEPAETVSESEANRDPLRDGIAVRLSEVRRQ